MHVGNYLGLLHGSEARLAGALERVAEHHGDEPDIRGTCRLLAGWSRAHVQALGPLLGRYQERRSPEPDALEHALFRGPRSGGLGLLRDLHDLWLMANEVQLCWTLLEQAAQALRDDELETLCQTLSGETRRQVAFLLNRAKQAAPQALVVA